MVNNYKRPNFSIILLLLLTTTLFPSCVTQKKKDDVTKFKLAYHNINARFNGYYNANVLIDESIDKLNDSHHDNYNQVLAIFPASDVTDAKSVYGDLDEAIKKSSVVISLHRPSKWVDDSYYTIAKAQFLKRDYESAEETLLYLGGEFSPLAMAKKKAKKAKHKKKKRKKKKRRSSKKKKKKKAKKKKVKKKAKKKLSKKEMRERYLKKKAAEALKTKQAEGNSNGQPGQPSTKKNTSKKKKKYKPVVVEHKSYGRFEHKPAYQRGQILLAQNYAQRKMYDDAAYILRKLEQSPELFSKLKPQLLKVKADLFLKQEKYQEAIPVLEEAVSLIKKRKKKVRLIYILGQLYQKQGQEKEAYKAFAKVVKYKPSYEMAFSAKMNVALNSWLSGNSTADDAIQSLKDLLKDSKNKDYKDQLYFTLAQLYQKQGDTKNTIAALESSLEFNTGNQSQIVESSLMLADLYFAKADFINAKKYYDKTLLSLDKADSRYSRVVALSENLEGIAKNLTIIQFQDSLLQVAGLSKGKQRALAIKLLEEKLLKEAEAKAKEDAKLANARGTLPSPRAGAVKSTFFAYDANKVKKGKKLFLKEWGERELKDNWRRSASQDIAENGVSNTTNDQEEGYSDEDIAQMLEGLPSSPKEKAKARSKIYQAMFVLGSLYRDRLEDNEKSMAVLEDQLQRYPDSTRLQLDAYYYLYLSSRDLSLSAKEKKYYDLIMNDYGNSTYAHVISDPNYLKSLANESNKVNLYYDKTYSMFKANKYSEAAKMLKQVDKMFGQNNPMEAKFSLLSAMLGGAMNGKAAYISGLNQVVAKYQNTDEEKRAKEILRVLGQNVGPVGSVGNASKEKKKIFKVEENRMHFILISLDANEVVVSDVKNALSNFDKKNFKLQKFRISNIYLGSNVKNPIVVVRKFKNKDKAMVYYNAIYADPDVRNVIHGAQIYAVSQGNYRKILRRKTLVGYDEFFKANYKK